MFFHFVHNKLNICPQIKPTEVISTSSNDLSISPNYNTDVWTKNNTQSNKNTFQFTMKREYVRAKEEALLLKQLKNVNIYFLIII